MIAEIMAPDGSDSFYLEEIDHSTPYYRMTALPGNCLGIPIQIHNDRKVVLCDDLEFPCGWKPGDGYFLVRLKEGMICVSWVDGGHHMNIEFRGSDPDKLIREVIRQDFVDKPHAAYIAAEIILAHRCLIDRTEYVQRQGPYRNIRRSAGGESAPFSSQIKCRYFVRVLFGIFCFTAFLCGGVKNAQWADSLKQVRRKRYGETNKHGYYYCLSVVEHVSCGSADAFQLRCPR